MSKLISWKEALIALANGEEVEFRSTLRNGYRLEWCGLLEEKVQYKLLDLINNSHGDQFRLKPKTITINGIEVPEPFEPKEGDKVWVISDYRNGYHEVVYNGKVYNALGRWRSEEEIKQVVEALRSVFKPQ